MTSASDIDGQCKHWVRFGERILIGLAKCHFGRQSLRMDNNWASENLQVIRTLMERSTLYRLALAPISLLTGVLGTGAAALGWFLKIESARGFVGYWMAVSV